MQLKFLKYSIFLSLFLLQSARAMERDDFTQKPSSLAYYSNNLENFLPEIIIHIATHLEGINFQSFILTSKPIYNIIKNHRSFSWLLNKEKLINFMEKTTIYEINSLISYTEKAPQQLAIPRLRNILGDFKIDYENEINSRKDTEGLKKLSKKFKEHIKLLNVLYALGNKKDNKEVVKAFKDTYEKIQTGLHSTMEQDDVQTVTILTPQLHIFYFKCFSLLNLETRKAVSAFYKEGTDPFMKDEKKSTQYSQLLNLPLSHTVFYQQ